MMVSEDIAPFFLFTVFPGLYFLFFLATFFLWCCATATKRAGNFLFAPVGRKDGIFLTIGGRQRWMENHILGYLVCLPMRLSNSIQQLLILHPILYFKTLTSLDHYTPPLHIIQRQLLRTTPTLPILPTRFKLLRKRPMPQFLPNDYFLMVLLKRLKYPFTLKGKPPDIVRVYF